MPKAKSQKKSSQQQANEEAANLWEQTKKLASNTWAFMKSKKGRTLIGGGLIALAATVLSGGAALIVGALGAGGVAVTHRKDIRNYGGIFLSGMGKAMNYAAKGTYNNRGKVLSAAMALGVAGLFFPPLLGAAGILLAAATVCYAVAAVYGAAERGNKFFQDVNENIAGRPRTPTAQETAAANAAKAAADAAKADAAATTQPLPGDNKSNPLNKTSVSAPEVKRSPSDQAGLDDIQRQETEAATPCSSSGSSSVTREGVANAAEAAYQADGGGTSDEQPSPRATSGPGAGK
jgi:hypothetical protein